MMLFFQPFILVWRRIDHFRMNHDRLSYIKTISFTYLLCFALSPLPSFAGSNYYLEAQVARTIALSENKANIIWLKTPEKREILALSSPSNTTDLQGGIIVLADLHQPPNWPVIVHGLRKYLPDFGWETLSVQMPIATDNLSNAQLDEMYTLTQNRIEAAVTYFQNKNISNINLIGMNQSANFSLKYVSSLPEEQDQIQSLVIIRAYDSNWLTSSDLVKRIPVPLLDIYPEHDSGLILASAKKRLASAGFSAKMRPMPRQVTLSAKVQKLAINKTGNLRYRQKVINGATYRFNKLEQTLFKAIRGWLGAYAGGSKVITK